MARVGGYQRGGGGGGANQSFCIETITKNIDTNRLYMQGGAISTRNHISLNDQRALYSQKF